MSWALTSTGNNAGSTGQIGSCQLKAAATNGSLLSVWVSGSYVGSSTPSGDVSLSDGHNSWGSPIVSYWENYYSNQWTYMACFQVQNVSATQLTISINYSGQNVSMTGTVIYIDEFTGISGSGSFVDGTPNIAWIKEMTTGSQTVPGIAITEASGDLISTFIYDTDYWSVAISALAASSGWTIAQNGLTNPGAVSGTAYQVSSSGSVTPSWNPTFTGTPGTYGDWVGVGGAAFKPTGTGSGGMNQVQEACWWRNPCLI